MTVDTFPAPEIAQIARQAHACWCQATGRRGWRPGTYDERARTHDALVPFEKLDKRDRLSALRAARYDAIEELASIIHYGRGPDRDFVLEEMRVGLPVIATGDDSSDQPAMLGHITDWALDADGELERIFVRWEDGVTSEHAAFSGELARAGE